MRHPPTTGHSGSHGAAGTAYPPLLCQRVVHCLANHLISKRPDSLDAGPLHPTALTSPNSKLRQTPLLSEYFLIADFEHSGQFSEVKQLCRPPVFLEKEGIEGEVEQGLDFKNAAEQPWTTWWPSSAKDCKQVFGVYRTPAQAFQAALKIRHPVSMTLAGEMTLPLPNVLVEAIHWTATRSPREIARHRVSQAKRILQLRSQLESEEAKLHSSLEPPL